MVEDKVVEDKVVIESKFKLGDVVKHKAGLRPMVIVQAIKLKYGDDGDDVDDVNGGDWKYQCEYQDPYSSAVREWFLEYTLEPWFASR